jgi:hypothetical protein
MRTAGFAVFSFGVVDAKVWFRAGGRRILPQRVLRMLLIDDNPGDAE